MKRPTDKERLNFLARHWRSVGKLDSETFFSCGKSFRTLRQAIDHAMRCEQKRKMGK